MKSTQTHMAQCSDNTCKSKERGTANSTNPSQIPRCPETHRVALVQAIFPRRRLLRPHEQARRRVLQSLGGRVLAADRGGPDRAGRVRGRGARPEGEPLQP